MRPRNYHVLRAADGDWHVKRDGAARASSIHDTQQAAIEAGRRLAKDAEVELRIHGRDGRIRDSDSYGKDPFPPSDQRH